MIRIMRFLSNNKWLLAYLLLVCGPMVIYSSFVTDSDDRHDLLIYNILFIIFFPMAFSLLSGWIRRIVLIIYSLFAIPTSLIETGWFLMDGSTLIRNQFYVIYATNPSEASGLLSLIEPWQWGVIACYFIVCLVLFIAALRESKSETHYAISVVGIIVLGGIVLVPGMRYNVPCINFYNSYRGYKSELNRVAYFMRNRTDITNEVCDELPDGRITIVVVIGESLNKNHCSLYGYCRPTTPRMMQIENLIVYQNVTSAYFMTQEVLQQMLTFATSDNPDARWNSPTLPEVLKAAGWHTYWYDPYEGRKNTSNTMPTSFSSIARLCDEYYISSESEQYDEAHLSHLEVVLEDSTFDRKAVFLHLIGNHFPYERRYPQAFRYFDDTDVCSPYKDKLTPQQITEINAYDDAVRYNDWLVDSIVSRLSKQDESCAMLYFSDHGEEVYDLDFYAGRSFNHVTRSLYEIPCLFWQNESFAQTNQLYIAPYIPYCTENMIHSLLDLFGVSYSCKDTCRSLFRVPNH